MLTVGVCELFNEAPQHRLHIRPGLLPNEVRSNARKSARTDGSVRGLWDRAIRMHTELAHAGLFINISTRLQKQSATR